MQRTEIKTRARDRGPALLLALERLLSFEQNEDSTDPKLHEAIRSARRAVFKVRGLPRSQVKRVATG
jgi:hypothetical protein